MISSSIDVANDKMCSRTCQMLYYMDCKVPVFVFFSSIFDNDINYMVPLLDRWTAKVQLFVCFLRHIATICFSFMRL